MNEYRDEFIEPTETANTIDESKLERKFQRRALTFMAFINVCEYLCWPNFETEALNPFFLIETAVVIALGLLTMWHAKLIYRGETSIEAHINAKETKRLSLQGKIFQNHYDFGPKKNFQMFLGLVNGR